MDAVGVVSELKKAGFSDDQAQAVTRVFSSTAEKFVTRDSLGARLENLELKLKLFVVMNSMAILGGMVALQRLGILS